MGLESDCCGLSWLNYLPCDLRSTINISSMLYLSFSFMKRPSSELLYWAVVKSMLIRRVSGTKQVWNKYYQPLSTILLTLFIGVCLICQCWDLWDQSLSLVICEVSRMGETRGLQICLKVTPKQLCVDEHKAQMTELEKAFHIRSHTTRESKEQICVGGCRQQFGWSEWPL